MQSFTKIMSGTKDIIVSMSNHANDTRFIAYADFNPETPSGAKCRWYIIPKMM